MIRTWPGVKPASPLATWTAKSSASSSVEHKWRPHEPRRPHLSTQSAQQQLYATVQDLFAALALVVARLTAAPAARRS